MASLSSFTFKPQQITSVDVAGNNLSGVYSNGPGNNGIGATYIIASGVSLDGIDLQLNFRVILPDQVNSYENGIYDVTAIGATDTILTRSKDFQCPEQIKPGYYVFVSNGDVYNGSAYVVKQVISKVGIDPITFSTLVESTSVTGSVVLGCSQDNLVGTYDNGPFNNGKSATLTVSSVTYTSIDGITLEVGQRFLLPCQNDTKQNGIYYVSSIDGTDTLFTRALDFDTADQVKIGYTISVSQGDVSASFIYVNYKSITQVGVDTIWFTSSSVFSETVVHLVSGSVGVFTVPGLSVKNKVTAILESITSPSATIVFVNVTGPEEVTITFDGEPLSATVVFQISAAYTRS